MAVYQPAGDSCDARIQFLMAQWLIFTENGQSAEATATEVKMNALGASMTGA